MMMKLGFIKIMTLGLVVTAFTACNFDKTTPNYTFMDDMYISPSVETYSVQGAMQPVENTIARGHLPYGYENNTSGYDSATANLMMPVAYADKAMRKKGEDLYVNMCGHCHGVKGDGNGILVEREKFLGVPGYSKTRLPNITPGSMYHVVMHGRNMMGSHASQLLEEERWEIISYIWHDLRGEEVASTKVETEEIEVEITE